MVGVLAFAIYAVSIVDTADSHANQLRSSPPPDSELETSPDRVVVWFSEEIEASLSEVRVIDANAKQVDNGDSAISPTQPTALIVTLPTLENGTYTVVWKNLSTVDGHRVVGSFRFAVGEPLSASPDVAVESQPLVQSPFDPWLRWLFFIGVLTLVGTLLFDLLVVMPTLDSQESSAVAERWFAAVQPILSRTIIGATVLALLSLVALLLQQAAVTFQVSIFAVFGEPLSGVVSSAWGRLWLWRFAAVVLTGLLVLLAKKATSTSDEQMPEDTETAGQAEDSEFTEDEEPYTPALTDSLFGGLAVIAGLGVLLLTSLSSHSAASPAGVRIPAIVTDFIHLLAASAWVGGLFLITTISVVMLRRRGTGFSTGNLLPLLSRFSPIAFVSAGTLVITGIVSGYLQVTIPAATATPYGWTLVTKLALIVPL
ncbi:MAG: copper resistance protein CopC, partial [Cyanobacteria bacterium]|nr:copper resistance protein CopC [Cyanobacteriota bacterium]